MQPPSRRVAASSGTTTPLAVTLGHLIVLRVLLFVEVGRWLRCRRCGASRGRVRRGGRRDARDARDAIALRPDTCCSPLRRLRLVKRGGIGDFGGGDFGGEGRSPEQLRPCLGPQWPLHYRYITVTLPLLYIATPLHAVTASTTCGDSLCYTRSRPLLHAVTASATCGHSLYYMR